MERILGPAWLLPVLDEHNRAYITTGRLMVQACRSCGTVQHPPEDLCRSCGSHEVGPRESAGRGRIESAVVVHRAVHPALKDHVPYTVVLVSIDDAPGVNLVGNLRGAAANTAKIGARVRVVFEDVADPAGDRLLIPQWELVA
jgi:uncharacterized OB-fold protein